MTTQSEQDELRRKVARIFKYYTVAASAGLNATRAKTVIDAEKSLNECTEAVAHLLHQRELSLLAEVEKRIIDVKAFNHAACSLNGKDHGESCVAQSKLQDKQRQTLQTIRQERLGTKEEKLKDE